MSKDTHAPTVQQQLKNAIHGLHVAMLTTPDGEGLLTSKPMHLLEFDDAGAFWFYCPWSPESEAAFPQGHGGHPFERANLAFTDASSSRYVSVACRGELVRDRARIHALWTPMAKPWFPEGPDAPNLAALRLVPVQAELWTGPGNGLTQALAFAASLITGKPVGMGEHQVLDERQAKAQPPMATR